MSKKNSEEEQNNLLDLEKLYLYLDRNCKITLDDTEKEIISLKVISGLAFDEISKLLNKPTGTIKWKYYRSIYTLRLLLSNSITLLLILCISLKLLTLFLYNQSYTCLALNFL